MANKPVRWRFPRIEGIIVNKETGEWSDGAFLNGLLGEDDQSPVVWYQAAPEDDVTDIAAWERWKTYLETRQGVGEELRVRALSDAKARLWALDRRRR